VSYQPVEQQGYPIISVDCKKKELIGNFKNNGREWQAKREETTVNVYDFLSLADGKAIPYEIYDLVHNHGFVNVGINHETAEFAVESIRRWWQQCGKALNPGKKELLITADGGGSNGVKNRLWKKKLQELANEEQLAITVVHYPPATSKWNKIEHRLFSFISMNWRAKPLTSLEVVLELISHTKTKEGLGVTTMKDSHVYPTGLKVTDEELAALNLFGDSFHGEWNYTIRPQSSLS
jgi:Rhodopirellula transposase DDE domain